MSKDESDTYLRFGQGIIVKGYKAETDPDQGYLTVRGFADVRANYETVEDILFFKNYRNAIFEFLPAGNFEINDELEKLKSKVVDSPDEEAEKNKMIQSLSPRADSERVQFDLAYKRYAIIDSAKRRIPSSSGITSSSNMWTLRTI